MMTRNAESSRVSARRTSSASSDGTAIRGAGADLMTISLPTELDAFQGKKFPSFHHSRDNHFYLQHNLSNSIKTSAWRNREAQAVMFRLGPEANLACDAVFKFRKPYRRALTCDAS